MNKSFQEGIGTCVTTLPLVHDYVSQYGGTHVESFLGGSLMSGSMLFDVDGSSTWCGIELEPALASLDLFLGFFGDIFLKFF
jgi:hypothetical protein